MSHSDAFLTFLGKAGTLASQLAEGFNDLPAGIKAAALASLGVAAVSSKFKGLGGKNGLIGGLVGKFTKGGVQKVFVTNPGFGTGIGVPGKPGKPTVGPTPLPGILGFPLPGASGIGAETRDPFRPRGAMKIPLTDVTIGGPERGAKRVPDSQLNMKQLKSLYGDVLQNGTGRGRAADAARLRELQGLMDGLKNKSAEFAHGFDAAQVKVQHLNNEVKLIGNNARGSRAEVQRLLTAIDKTHVASTLLAQGVTAARTDKVGAQLGENFRGVLSIDKDGVAYINGVAQKSTTAGRARAAGDHRKAGTDGIRNR